jgi:SAM-dependent methyltransferase
MLSAVKHRLRPIKRRFFPIPTVATAAEIDAALRHSLAAGRQMSGSYVYQHAIFQQQAATARRYGGSNSPEGAAPLPKRTLHVGCGDTVGTDILLCDAGVEKAVALDPARAHFELDGFLATWRCFHESLVSSAVPSGRSCLRLSEVESADGNRFSVLRPDGSRGEVEVCEGLTLEESGLEEASFDYIFSNATLEHVHDPRCCVRELRRLLEPGGIMAHQIDLRDHADFERPLEFLRVPEDEWAARMAPLQGDTCHMNRWRLSQWTSALEQHGFELLECDINISLDEHAAQRERPLLAAPYSNAAIEDLTALSVWLVARRS